MPVAFTGDDRERGGRGKEGGSGEGDEERMPTRSKAKYLSGGRPR